MFNGRNQQLESTVILNSGFWAHINIAEFQKERNIPLQMPVETVKSALITAMQELELDLKDVEQRYKARGINNVQEIAQSTVNNENPAQTLYKKAVFARAKADLLPEFFALSAREIHQNRDYVEEQKSLLAEATRAIRTLKGKKRGSVHLL
ncbi:head completion/stabilization protein [Pasteurella multocida]|uniref:head completion/stabilization protein n=1 Tax=Pasteurella multocida TaxID=747 RepID=UPI000E828A94|nr:head completion/stabilization protein [Pasteurella multocida]MEB3457141.1 head completion/stabilization protein [Pasteurella multocida]HAS03331.1 head stabilization protein [Pasteurella multocida]HEA3268091.1 head completion/stabilization protein [Pasteurella multocida]